MKANMSTGAPSLVLRKKVFGYELTAYSRSKDEQSQNELNEHAHDYGAIGGFKSVYHIP